MRIYTNNGVIAYTIILLRSWRHCSNTSDVTAHAFSFQGNDTILQLEVTPPPTQFSVFGDDVILLIEVMSPSTHYSNLWRKF